MAQPHTLGGALDQAGNVGADKALLRTDPHHAQNRGQSGEVIVCNFGLCGADDTDQGGFAHVGETDQAHVGNDLQFQRQVQFLAGQAGLGKFGNLAGGRGKPGISPAAAAAFGHHNRFVTGQVCHHQAGVRFLQHRAAGHADDQILGIAAFLAGAAAVFAVGSRVLAFVAEVHQSGQVVIGHKDNAAAAAAVAAVRAAGCHKLFAVEADTAVTALAAVDPDGSHINKITGHEIPLSWYGTTAPQVKKDYGKPWVKPLTAPVCRGNGKMTKKMGQA